MKDRNHEPLAELDLELPLYRLPGGRTGMTH